MADNSIPVERFNAIAIAAAMDDIATVLDFFVDYHDYPTVYKHFGGLNIKPENSAGENAFLFIIHKHYFNKWNDYVLFTTEVKQDNSIVQQFEKAADAIVAGDAAALKKLLEENPELIYKRSLRNHHATLLNYVGANGVEYWRQKTPANIVEIAKILLNAGAEIDAVGDMYGGSTTLGLVATSVHPVKAGVQEALMDILIKHGADPNIAVAPDYTDGLLIRACLANGRGEPVEYLARQGAKLDMEAAGGVGDIEKVKSYFNEDGSLKDKSLTKQRDTAFIWACKYGRINVVEFMLNNCIDANTEVHGMSALHSAVIGGDIKTIKLLLDKNPSLEIKNCYDGTVLGQVLWSAYNQPKPNDMEIIDTLIAAWAVIEPGWEKYIEEIRERG